MGRTSPPAGTLHQLAAFVQDPHLNPPTSKRSERIAMHVADTLGAVLAGSRLEEARAGRSLASPSLACCAAARSTEVDRIPVELGHCVHCLEAIP